jgi:uncharacterized repeat protein (TIGR01451 family)
MKRNLSKLVSCLSVALLVTAQSHAATFSVGSTSDGVDATPGDGICLATEDKGCTLRAAIMEANASPGADIIDLTAINDPASPIVLTIEGVDENWVASEPASEAPCFAEVIADAAIGDLDITDDLEIFGAGPGLTVIEWENQSLDDPAVGDRIFHVQAESGMTINLVRIADLMIRNGSVGVANSVDPQNPYNCEEPTGEPGAITVWQFKRVGGGITAGPGAAVFLFEEAEHGPGGGGGDEGGPPIDPGGDEGEGGITAVEFERIAMIGNQAGSDGGAILAAAEMSITDSVFSGNHSEANGGALYIDSATTIYGTLIGTSASDIPFETGAIAADLVSQPNMAENGGGIFDTGSHTTNIEASAINGNQAIGGGGIAARSLIVVNLTNTTVSGNTGSDVGGGITTNGTINLRNVTVANNVATTDAPGGGAGLNSFGSGTYVFYNTILSGNIVLGGETEREANCGCSGGAAACPDGRMVSTGYNINDEAADTCSLLVALSDQPLTDPLLKPLANNGGLTETHALQSVLVDDPVTSPAIDSADNLRCPNNDQRGSLRPDDGDGDGNYDCDIGAFELFVPRADLHINNVVAPNQVDKGDTFTAIVEIHNDDANVAAPGVEFTATLDTLVNMAILEAATTAGTCGIPAHTVSCAIGDMAVSAVETVELTLVGNVQGSYSLESVVEAAAGVFDPVPGNNSVLTSISVLGNADVALTADPVPAEVDQGDTIVFGYAVTNNGEDEATTVRLGMVIPTSTSFVSASSTKGNCSEGGGEIRCGVGTLALAESAIIEVQLSADESGDTDFTAVVTADQNDPDSSNNSVAAPVTVISNADLELSGSGPGNITIGGEFDVTVTITNNGPQVATNYLLTATVPDEFGFVSAEGCELVEGTLECAGDAIAATESTTFTIRFSADTLGTADVNALVVADENDPDESNNALDVSVTINPVPPPPASDGGGGGGGCVYNPGSPADPILPLLLMVALMAIGLRHRTHA